MEDTASGTREPASDVPAGSESKCRRTAHAGRRCSFCGQCQRDYPERIYHRFPTDPILSEKWAAASSKRCILAASPEHRRRFLVCSAHFSDEDYCIAYKKRRLDSEAVPASCLDLKVTEAKRTWMSMKIKLKRALLKGSDDDGRSDAVCLKYDQNSEKEKQSEQEAHGLISDDEMEVSAGFDASHTTIPSTPNVSSLLRTKVTSAVSGAYRQSVNDNSSSTANSTGTTGLSVPKVIKTLRQPYVNDKSNTDLKPVTFNSRSKLPLNKTMDSLREEIKYVEHDLENPACVAILLLPKKRTFKDNQSHESTANTSPKFVASNFPNVSRLSPVEKNNTVPGKRMPVKYNVISLTHSPSMPNFSLPEKMKALQKSHQCNDVRSAADSATLNSPSGLKLSCSEATNSVPSEFQPMEHDSSSTSDSFTVPSLPSLESDDNLDVIESAAGSEAKKTLRKPHQCNEPGTSSTNDSALSKANEKLQVNSKLSLLGGEKQGKIPDPLTDSKDNLHLREKESDSTDIFFLQVASTVKKFSLDDQNTVKWQILDLVNNIKEKYVTSQTKK